MLVSDLYELSQRDIGQAKMRAAMGELLTRVRRHLALEQRHVYAVLAATAKPHSALATTLRIFAPDTAAITQRLLDLLGQCATGASIDGFAENSTRALLDLRELVRREENLLFPEFERIQEQAPCAEASADDRDGSRAAG
jgi:Hemerythrin HHE cation binding domain